MLMIVFFAIFSSVTGLSFSPSGFDRPEPRDMIDKADERRWTGL